MAEKTNYGGQAVMEGVMMRGRQDMAVAVRAPSGEIALYHEPIVVSRATKRVRHLPFIRGVFVLWETMQLGLRALVFSANVGIQEDEEANHAEPSMLAGAALWGAVAISLLFSIGLFFILPLAVVTTIDHHIHSSLVSNVVEGLIRLAILVGYMLAIGQLKDIRRVFAYHGAEHKTINAYEAGDPLDVEHVRRHSLRHPRCGTGFLLVVVLLSIIVFAFLGRPDLLLRIASRIVLVPVVAGIAYEFLKWTAAHDENPLVRAIITPSMAMQGLTTREPDDSMLEVAVLSLKRVLVSDGVLAKSELVLPGVVEVDEAGRSLPLPELQPEPAVSLN